MVRHRYHYASTLKKLPRFYRDIFWFFLKDESFVSKTLNEGHVELTKFPASTVCQLAKKMESSQATAKHMEQVTRAPQPVQVNLLCHQCTEIPPSKSQIRKKNPKFKQESNRSQEEKPRISQEYNRRRFNQQENICIKCDDSLHREGFRCPASKHQCKICHKIGHFSSLCFKKKNGLQSNKNSFGPPKAHQLKAGLIYVHDTLSGQSEEYSSEEDEPFYLQMKVQEQQDYTSVPVPKHLFTNLEFKVHLHKNKIQFLRARVDICADVNLIPMSIYKRLFKDEECREITPSNLQLGAYTNKKVKILGSCNLYIVHPHTRCLEEIWFYVAGNEGSILMSCATSIALGLIKPHKKLDHLPPHGKKHVIYGSADKIKRKDESLLTVQQTNLKPSTEKITVGCSQGEQYNNENKKCQAKRSEERNIRSKKPLQNRQLQNPPIHMWSVTKEIDM